MREGKWHPQRYPGLRHWASCGVRQFGVGAIFESPNSNTRTCIALTCSNSIGRRMLSSALSLRSMISQLAKRSSPKPFPLHSHQVDPPAEEENELGTSLSIHHAPTLGQAAHGVLEYVLRC